MSTSFVYNISTKDTDIPLAPPSLNIDFMTPDEVKLMIQQGVDETKKGNLLSFEEVKKRMEKLMNEEI